MNNKNRIKKEERPVQSLQNVDTGELYSCNLDTEYRQCMEEGLQVEPYQALMREIQALPVSPEKEQMADALFTLLSELPLKDSFAFEEPNDLEAIHALSSGQQSKQYILPDEANHRDKLLGAWTGRAAGCLLGKPLEGLRTDRFIPFLQATQNAPLHRYITEEDVRKCPDVLFSKALIGKISFGPVDDDTNYTVMYQNIIEKYGRNFTPKNICDEWISTQPKNAYFTAERVAYLNYIHGYLPPFSARYKNPFREWIGAQIRGDYFGYINPGNPRAAADMSWRDASLSHTKNGIYGEMFVAAMLAAAACSQSIVEILEAGLAQIPSTSRLHEAVNNILKGYQNGISKETCFQSIHQTWDEYIQHHWCHTISNASIVTASLLYGEKDFAASICMAVECGFDTDCNGATVGSVLGMLLGAKALPVEWISPLNGAVETSITGRNLVPFEQAVQMTLKHCALAE